MKSSTNAQKNWDGKINLNALAVLAAVETRALPSLPPCPSGGRW
jgi:hypothetical protein